MTTECYPISILPHASRIFLDYVERRDPLAPFYAASPYAQALVRSRPPQIDQDREQPLPTLLEAQNRSYGAGDPS